MIKDYLTIIIPCKNEEGYIEKTLESINLQFGISGTRIIIADGGSEDKTLHQIEKFISSGISKIKVEIIQGGSVSKGRNSGASLAQTKYILFLDADVTIPNECGIYFCLNSLIRDTQNVLLGTTPVYRGSKPDFRAKLIFFVNSITTHIISKFQPFAVGSFMMIERETFNQLGGFDESLHQSEDWMLSRKVSPENFILVGSMVTQDNRRFKKFGYFNMVKMVIKNWMNRKNLNHFKKDINYWEKKK
jgi:glycosyltransferase involved in cell wall biosynthesis